MTTPSRRQFIKASAASAAIAAGTRTSKAETTTPAPAEKMRIGFIGPGGR